MGATSVTGAGTANQPYVIDSKLYLTAGGDGTIAIAINGTGSVSDPYVINASQDIYLDDLIDVVASGGSSGDVLAKQADGTFALVPPVTATPGAIATDQSLTGDGSSGAPLGVALAASGGLVSTPTGLAVSGFTDWTDYTPLITTSGGDTITLDAGSEIEGRYVQIGKTVFLSIVLRASLNIPSANGYYSFSLPVPDAHTAERQALLNVAAYLNGGQSGQRGGTAVIEGTNRVNRIRIDAGEYERNLAGNFPQWGSYAFRIIVHGFYEAA